MNKVFNIEENRLLQFSDMQCKYSRTGRQKMDSDWFCKPRARPVAFATTTNEMPELCTSFGKTLMISESPVSSPIYNIITKIDLNMMDWSVNDQMALSFDENLIIWRNRDDTSMIFNVERTSSLKYSPNGKYLAIGCKDDENPGKYYNRSFDFLY